MPSALTTSSRTPNVQRSTFNVQRSPSSFRIPHSAFRISPAFTLIELLVVVGIIVVLVGILIPAISYARRVADKAANTAQLSAIQSGLQQYYADFTMYPPSNSSTTPIYTGMGAGRGPAMLAEALMGYMGGTVDGAGPDTGNAAYAADPRFGFRTRNVLLGGVPAGKIYGPYCSDDPKGFKINLPLAAGNTTDAAFIDIFGHEILYFASTRQGVNNTSTVIPTQIFGTAAVLPNALNTSICYFNALDDQNNYAGSTLTPLTYANGSAAVPTTTIPAPPSTNNGPTTLFFQNLAGRPSNNLLNTGSAPVMGANSFLLICQGEDGNPYTDDDIIVTNR